MLKPITRRRILVGAAFAITAGHSLRAGAADALPDFQKNIAPLLERYCSDCHGDGQKKGDVNLDVLKPDPTAAVHRALWERIVGKVRNHEMPPEKKPQPTNVERDLLAHWVDLKVFECDCHNPDPGRVTIRRLNRAEYNNTVRDLLGVNFKPADNFPVDDSGYGFDNIGDALSMPPLLIEKYLAAAQKVIEAAFALHVDKPPVVKRFPVDLLEVGYNARQRGDGWVFLNSIEEDDVAVNLETTAAGEFTVRVHAYAKQESTNAMKLTFMLGNQPIKVVEVNTNAANAAVYEAAFHLAAGKNRVRAVVRRVKDGLPETEALKWKTGPPQKGAVFVEWLEIEGPMRIASAPENASLARLLSHPPAAGNERAAASEFLTDFVRRAYRRPVTAAEVERLVNLAAAAWQRGDPFVQGIQIAMQAVLVSPHFLYRGEIQPEPDNPAAIHPVNEFALASRLSYFLWSSMPDKRLFTLAAENRLRANLESEVKRMLQDAKVRALTDNFAGQWLQFRSLDLAAPDAELFKKFDGALRAAMRRETELFFENVVREDRSVLDFVAADYTFVNARLAKHYGLQGITGDDFQRVSLSSTPRRGVVTHGSVLLLTSNPTRTSPVKRGKWVLENLLNAPPPPPPPDVPELKEGKELTGTLRQRLEQHRTDPLCASCHARMDPIGFGLENFDAIGAWREKDGAEPIDASGNFTTGESFKGALDLVEILATRKKDQFLRCLTEKMLIYALGRGLEYYDKCAVDEITRELNKDDRISTLVLAIVKSTPFQMRRGDEARK